MEESRFADRSAGRLRSVPRPGAPTPAELVATAQRRLAAVETETAALRAELAELAEVIARPALPVPGTGPLLITLNQAADMLGVKLTTIRTLIGSGALPSSKIGALRRIAVADLERYVAGLAAA